MTSLLKTIIVDDEPIARSRMRQLLADHANVFQLIEEAESGDEAVEKINRLKPDLVLLDIQMPELDGFEVLGLLDYSPIVVFCTAHDVYALKAFEVCCVDYLLKPITKERFGHLVDKLQQLQGGAQDLKQLMQYMTHENSKVEMTTIPVKIGDRVIFLSLEDISYFEADEKYVSIVTKHNKHYMLDSSLKKLAEKLPSHFLRVHKSHIVNTNRVKEIRKYFNHRFILLMDDYVLTKITSGRLYYSEIKTLSEL